MRIAIFTPEISGKTNPAWSLCRHLMVRIKSFIGFAIGESLRDAGLGIGGGISPGAPPSAAT